MEEEENKKKREKTSTTTNKENNNKKTKKRRRRRMRMREKKKKKKKRISWLGASALTMIPSWPSSNSPSGSSKAPSSPVLGASVASSSMFTEISSATWNAVTELTVIHMEIHVWFITTNSSMNSCANGIGLLQFKLACPPSRGILPIAIDLTDTQKPKHTHRQTDASETFTLALSRAAKIIPFHLNLMVNSTVMWLHVSH